MAAIRHVNEVLFTLLYSNCPFQTALIVSRLTRSRSALRAPNQKYPRTKSSGIFLAGLVDRSWNTLWPSLLRMYNQLVELGFRYVDSEIILKDEEGYDE